MPSPVKNECASAMRLYTQTFQSDELSADILGMPSFLHPEAPELDTCDYLMLLQRIKFLHF